MLKSIYIAIIYRCNHNCTYCPCTMDMKLNDFLTFEEIKKFVDNYHYNHFTISGGEPTIHPEFCGIVNYLSKIGNLVILSNADRFSDYSFLSNFLSKVTKNTVRVVTTLHSHKEALHELSNRSMGSFRRTLQGLKNLYESKIDLCVKHCITLENYKYLRDFVRFVYDTFPSQVDLQFSGIDYTRVDKISISKITDSNFFSGFLEDALESVNLFATKHILRRVYCSNIPLCHVDPYYWSFFHLRNTSNYNGYLSSRLVSDLYINDTIGLFSPECEKCVVKDYCSGTYKSAFDLFGDSFVKPILHVT